jgi:hypothetical protein
LSDNVYDSITTNICLNAMSLFYITAMLSGIITTDWRTYGKY